jgi:hypothetical protein
MMKGILPKLSLGVALAGAIALTLASPASADLAGSITFTEPAQTLLMPFDVTDGRASFQIISRIGFADNADPVIATHWSYWSKDCRHLADVLICLTQRDTIVVDPTALQGEFQGPSANVKTGPVINLSGERGLVVVTAFVASDASQLRNECAIPDATATIEDAIVGSWTIANPATNAAFGHDAIGTSTNSFPDAATFFGATDAPLPFYLQTFNPTTLQDSEVIFLTAEFSESSGNGRFLGNEIGPSTLNSPKVTCNATFIDNLEVPVSLPDIQIDCASFAPISTKQAKQGETPLIPPTTAVNTSGLLQLSNCLVDNPVDDPSVEGIGDSSTPEFLFAFHGQAVGPFGTIDNGKYTGGLSTNGG